MKYKQNKTGEIMTLINKTSYTTIRGERLKILYLTMIDGMVSNREKF